MNAADHDFQGNFHSDIRTEGLSWRRFWRS